MKFGFRKPSLNKRIAARTSWKRVVRHSLGIKAPRGYGWLTNPRRAAYNRVYNRTTVGCAPVLLLVISTVLLTVEWICHGRSIFEFPRWPPGTWYGGTLGRDHKRPLRT